MNTRLKMWKMFCILVVDVEQGDAVEEMIIEIDGEDDMGGNEEEEEED